MVLIASLLGGAALAQETAVQGPLASPGASSEPATAKSKPAKKVRRHAKAKPASDKPEDAAAAQPDPAAIPQAGAPTSRAQHASGSHPMDFSFKWHGNNDTSESTRVQNYNGDAVGTGAALGLNLHF